MNTVKNNQRDLTKETFIKIPNNWILGKEKNNLIDKYTNKGLILYCLLKLCNTYLNKYKLTHYDIEEWFGVRRKRDKIKIINIIKKFNKDNIIKLMDKYNLDDIPKQNIYFTFPNLNNDYFIVYHYEIVTILQVNQPEIDKYNLLLIFLAIKRHYSTQTKICYPGIDDIAKCIKLSHENILQGIQTLQNIELILYDNPGTKILNDGSIRESNNIYTMNYANNDIILQEYINKQKYNTDRQYIKQYNKKIANKKRSIKMKLNNLEEKYKNKKINQQQYIQQKNTLQKQYNKINNQ